MSTTFNSLPVADQLFILGLEELCTSSGTYRFGKINVNELQRFSFEYDLTKDGAFPPFVLYDEQGEEVVLP